jgi:aryl-alcohol dehydrogenase-like predicted oxidoreductase
VFLRRFKKTGKRDQIFLATKFGFTESGINGTPEYVRAAAEKSLKRLGIETIDLYYLHVSLVISVHVSLET